MFTSWNMSNYTHIIFSENVPECQWNTEMNVKRMINWKLRGLNCYRFCREKYGDSIFIGGILLCRKYTDRMARIARVIAPGAPHHVTQRGNRRQQTFFCDEDYLAYLELLAQWCGKNEVDIWAWCLMPNHVHLIAVPQTEDGLARAIGETHRRYTLRVNGRENWRGHFWQERFASFPLDDRHLLAVARYIEMNPVAAGLADRPDAYRWSSARAHLHGAEDSLVNTAPLLGLVEIGRAHV